MVFDKGSNRGDESRSEVSSSEAVREQFDGTKERLKDGTNETTGPDQSAVRPSPRGGEKSNYGPKYSLREDVRSYRERNEEVSGTHKRKSLGDGASIRVLDAKPIAQLPPTITSHRQDSRNPNEDQVKFFACLDRQGPEGLSKLIDLSPSRTDRTSTSRKGNI